MKSKVNLYLYHIWILYIRMIYYDLLCNYVIYVYDSSFVPDLHINITDSMDNQIN